MNGTREGKRMKTNTTMLLLLALAMALGHVGCDAADGPASGRRPEPVSATPHGQGNTMKISLKFQDKTVTATLIDNETSRDFVSLLPLTLTMDDLFGREKFAHLPRAISAGGERTKTYEVGDLIYWSPGPDVAIFYRHDGKRIPDPGIIVMGRLDSGVEALNVPGSVKVTVELVTGDEQAGRK
jgi:hypothetical protein